MKQTHPFDFTFLLLLTLLIITGCAITSSPTPVPLPPIIIDGQFNDWTPRKPTLTDPTGDAGKSDLDLLALRLAHNDTHFLIHIQLNYPINLQSDRALYLTLNTDDDLTPDLFYDFGNRAGAFKGHPVTQFDLGLVTLPSHTSAEFEIALARDSLPKGALFPTDSLSLTLKDPAPTGGDILPDQGTISYTFATPPEPGLLSLSIEKPTSEHIRLITWNMLRDGMFDNDRAPAFQRILTTLQPDVIAFQEVYNRTAKSVQTRLEEWLGGTWYTIQVGDLVTASRTPFLEDWTDTYQPLIAARTFPVMLAINGTKFILFNAHLSCCDADAERQEQIDRVIAFLRDADFPAHTPFFFVGDLNLVGDADQLTTLLTGDILDETQFGLDHFPDWDTSPLTDLIPHQTHAPFAYTWRDDTDTYPPGRLDYILYTDSLLTPDHSFIFYTANLSPELLAQYTLEKGDSMLASDHLPLVMDFIPVP